MAADVGCGGGSGSQLWHLGWAGQQALTVQEHMVNKLLLGQRIHGCQAQRTVGQFHWHAEVSLSVYLVWWHCHFNSVCCAHSAMA